MFTVSDSKISKMEGVLRAYAYEVVSRVASHKGFDVKEVLSLVGYPELVVEKRNTRSKVVLLPWTGEVKEDSCQGIRVNHGLYTQCLHPKATSSSYCTTCGSSGGPKHGDIKTRGTEYFVHKSKVLRYSQVMTKLGISREEAELAASSAGVTIAESEFEKVETSRRGRPRKHVDVLSSDSDGGPKKRGRPKKQKSVVARSAGDDLIASLMASAEEASDGDASSSGDSSAVSSEEKLAEKAAKKEAKLAAKAAEKAEKDAAKAADKEAKLAAEGSR